MISGEYVYPFKKEIICCCLTVLENLNSKDMQNVSSPICNMAGLEK